MIIDNLFNRNPTIVEGSAANDYFARRKSEEERIAGTRAPAKNKKNPATTDYSKRRAQEKKVQQGVTESAVIQEIEKLRSYDYTGGKYQLSGDHPPKQLFKLPGGSGLLYSIKNTPNPVIQLWDPKNLQPKIGPKPVKRPYELAYEYYDRLDKWEEQYEKLKQQGRLGNKPLCIGQLTLNSANLPGLKDPLEVDSITVDEDYRGRGLAKALYGIVLAILKKPLVAGQSQTPGGQKNWVSISQIPGVQVYGYVMIDNDDLDKYTDEVMGKLGGDYMGPSGGYHFFRFAVQPNASGKELASYVKTKAINLYGQSWDTAIGGLYAVWEPQQMKINETLSTAPVAGSNKTINREDKKMNINDVLLEFAPGAGGGGGSGDYLRALASAWYNETFNTGSLKKGIKSQEDVERLLALGIVSPDGKTRKYNIDYNPDFDGVVIFSDDYYEHDDGSNMDSRTGQKWGPYDYIEFSGEELDESVDEGVIATLGDDPWGPPGNFAGDRPINVGDVSMKTIKVGDTVKYFGQKVKVVAMSKNRKYSRIKIPSDFGGTTKDVLTSDLKQLGQGMAEGTDEKDPNKKKPKKSGLDLSTLRTAAKTAKPASELPKKQEQGMAEGLLDEKSTSQAQFRTMAAAAHNPEFARKVGIKQSVAKEFNRADKGRDYKNLPKKANESKKAPAGKEADYGDDYQDMVKRVKKLAGLGPLQTVYDPHKRVYRNVPRAQQPKKPNSGSNTVSESRAKRRALMAQMLKGQ